MERVLHRLRTSRRGALQALTIAALTLGVSAIHALTPAEFIDVHYLIQRLFYVPVVCAGVWFGWRGGLAAGVLAGLVYLPQIIAIGKLHPRYSINQYTEVVLFCLVGALIGFITTRQNRQRRELEKTARELVKAHAELQDNFEKMRRGERLYALGQMSSGLAHEIRNPLASIEGAAAVLLREPPSEERRVEFLQIIQKESRRLNRLLSNFLAFARPPKPEYRTVTLHSLLDSVISLATHAVGSRSDLRLRKELAGSELSIDCDPEQVKQVLLNLTINAIQAMTEGGDIVLIARQRANRVIIEVRDEGNAVKDGDLERLFDPFFTTKATGTGLGLSIAHQIAAIHNGTVTARRNPDRGMTFTLELPLSREGSHME